MRAELILIALVEWAIRATILAGTVSMLLWVARVRNVHALLTAWTMVLVGALCMPIVQQLLPPTSLPLPGSLVGHHRSFTQAVAPPLPRDARPIADRPPNGQGLSGKSPGRSWPNLAAIAWALIASGMLIRVLVGLFMGAKLVRSSRAVEKGFRESNLLRAPVTVGLIRPVIVLPADWREWDASRLRGVLAHERAHVDQRDPLRYFAASIYRSLAWFHPLAWWLRAKLVEMAEAASDDVALAEGEDRIAYAEMLLAFIERSPGRVASDGAAMASRGSRSRRLKRILDSNRELSRPLRRPVLAAIVAVTLPLIYSMASVRPVRAGVRIGSGAERALPALRDATATQRLATFPPPPVHMPPDRRSPQSKVNALCGGDNTYSRWPNTEIAYILTAGERNAFEKLRSAEQCAQFIEQFWRERDLDPSTPENEFREEHLRRVTYANRNFTSTIPGWQTDRGRVYITSGPPAEIERHPSGEAYRRPAEQAGGSTETYPFEKWRYRQIKGLGDDVIFEFVDTSLNGNYSLALVVDAERRAQLEGRVP